MAEAENEAAFDPSKEYAVTWARRVTLGGQKLPLLGEHIVAGATLNEIVKENGADAVAAALPR